MQRISVANLQPGMVTAYNVFNSDGSVLIKSDIPLTNLYVKRLKQFGLGSIYIKNPLLEGMEIPEIVKEDTKKKAIQVVQHAFKHFVEHREVDIEPFKLIANSLADEVILNRESMIHLADTRTFDEYLYGHSVNVCLLALLTGLLLDYNVTKLREMALGVLLHDLGQTLVPNEIVSKPGKLTSDEMNVIRQHTEFGFEALRKVREMSTPAAHVAFQHHENFDGSGYPRGLKGTDIHEYSRITSIANMYDALISDRPYRKAFLPHEAYEILMTLGHKYFDPKILDVFLANVAIYPIGSVVTLSTGETGVVTNVVRRMQTRPIVKIICDEKGQVASKQEEIDLTQNNTIFINKLLNEQDVIALTMSSLGKSTT